MSNVSSLESRWLDEDVIKDFDEDRALFRPASAKVVRKVFQEYVRPEDTILEIGSGLGELVKLVPEYKKRIIQSEQSTRTARENKRVATDVKLAVTNVYRLPFPDGSFDVITGFSVFDTLADLPQALAEVKRVLKPNGKFIHFLDMYASPNTVFWKYKDSDFVPFPAYGKDGSPGVRLFPKSQLEEFLSRASKARQGFYRLYVEKILS